MANPETAAITETQRRELAQVSGTNAATQKAAHDALTRRPASGRIDVNNVREAFTYAAWDKSQVDAGKEVTEALIIAAETVLRVVPESPLRTRAVNGLFDARMLANAAITHRGKF